MGKRIFSKIWILVIVIVVILTGGILVWQYFGTLKESITKKSLFTIGLVRQYFGTLKEKDIKKYLHKDAILCEASPPPGIEYNAISAKEAILFAIHHLKSKGVKNIKICEMHWIVAPLGGFLIDGKGDFTIGGKRYSTFRIGVRDGSEFDGTEEYAPGKEFVFIARGEDDKGNVIWYPEPGPDYQPAEGEKLPETVYDYKFLGYGDDEEKKRFETLSQRFK